MILLPKDDRRKVLQIIYISKAKSEEVSLNNFLQVIQSNYQLCKYKEERGFRQNLEKLAIFIKMSKKITLSKVEDIRGVHDTDSSDIAL